MLPKQESNHQPLLELETDPSNAKMEVFLSTRGQTFRRVMPLAMRNLAIAQQRDKERYNLVRGGSWAKPKASFEPGDYVLVKRVKPNTLEASAYPHVLRIVALRPSGIMVLEGSDGAKMHKSDEGRGALPPSNHRHHPPPWAVLQRSVDALLRMRR